MIRTNVFLMACSAILKPHLKRRETHVTLIDCIQYWHNNNNLGGYLKLSLHSLLGLWHNADSPNGEIPILNLQVWSSQECVFSTQQPTKDRDRHSGVWASPRAGVPQAKRHHPPCSQIPHSYRNTLSVFQARMSQGNSKFYFYLY